MNTENPKSGSVMLFQHSGFCMVASIKIAPFKSKKFLPQNKPPDEKFPKKNSVSLFLSQHKPSDINDINSIGHTIQN